MSPRGKPIIARRSAPAVTRGPGDRLDAEIVEIREHDVTVQLDGGSRGVVERQELSGSPRTGDRISVTYLIRDAQHGDLVLTPREPVETIDWERLEPGALVRGNVTALSRDGIAVDIGGNRAFLPAAQLGRGGEGIPPEFGRRTVVADVISVNPRKKEIRLGLRDRLRRREKAHQAGILRNLRAGQSIRGRVVRLNEYGAFVDLGGVDGLLHESKIQRYRETAEVPLELHEGTELDLQIISVDPDRGRVGLAFPLAAGQVRPSDVSSEFEVDERVTGLIQDVSPEGCRVLIDENTTAWLPAESFAEAAVDIERGHLLTARVAEIRDQSPRIQLKL